jgi:hypothetical protein
VESSGVEWSRVKYVALALLASCETLPLETAPTQHSPMVVARDRALLAAAAVTASKLTGEPCVTGGGRLNAKVAIAFTQAQGLTSCWVTLSDG